MQQTIVPPTTTAPYSFRIDSNGNTQTITYKRAKYGMGLAVTIFLIIGLFTIIPVGGMAGWTIWFMVSLLLTIGVFSFINFRRKEGSFDISDTHIRVKGRSYDLEHVNQLYFDSKTTNIDMVENRNTPLILLRNGIQGSIKRHVESNNYYIGFRYGEANVKLATGLRKDSAEVLYNKVISLTKGFNHR